MAMPLFVRGGAPPSFLLFGERGVIFMDIVVKAFGLLVGKPNRREV